MRKWWRRWQLAGQLARYERHGGTLLPVRSDLAGPARAYIWRVTADLEARRWHAAVNQIPLDEWVAAYTQQQEGRR